MTDAIDPKRLRSDAKRLAALALSEDGVRDLTTEVTILGPLPASGTIEFRSPGVLAGTIYADAVAAACECSVAWNALEGERVDQDAAAAALRGDLTGMLRAERPLLNLLQRASGIATLTRRFVEEVRGTGCRILHTRKTAPGLRLFDLNAVLAGGGGLHRADLAHVIMIKDNHWAAMSRQGRSLPDAAEKARQLGDVALYVEVESLQQLEIACQAGADRLMIDNQSVETVREWGTAARSRRPGIQIEATGGITLENARLYAEAGADFISIGALTHSVGALDISLEIAY